MPARNLAWLAAAALVVSSLLPERAPAQPAPIRFVVGTVPGGAIDPYARLIAGHAQFGFAQLNSSQPQHAVLASRAQRNTSEAQCCAAEPGPFQCVTVPDQRRTVPLRFTSHRIRDARAPLSPSP